MTPEFHVNVLDGIDLNYYLIVKKKKIQMASGTLNVGSMSIILILIYT